MTDALHILKVALDVPLDRVFDYKTDNPNTQIGQYVVVPFGARKMIGIVVGISDTTSIESKDRKSTRLNSSHIPLSRMPSSA